LISADIPADVQQSIREIAKTKLRKAPDWFIGDIVKRVTEMIEDLIKKSNSPVTRAQIEDSFNNELNRLWSILGPI
jgi:hypothetical protein